MGKESDFNNLYKKMDATAKTRFHASRRLRLHAKWATYSVVIISLGLILISLMQAYSLGNNIKSSLVGLMQVFSSVAVLVYSLLIDKNDYSNSSEKMYSCASQLTELKQKFRPFISKEYDEKTYSDFKDEYHKILKHYETHSINDFRGDYFRAKLEMPDFYQLDMGEWWLLQIKVAFTYLLNFISYPIVVGILSFVIGWIWLG